MTTTIDNAVAVMTEAAIKIGQMRTALEAARPLLCDQRRVLACHLLIDADITPIVRLNEAIALINIALADG